MKGDEELSRRINYEVEQQILSELDYLNGKSDYTREDFAWCYNTIHKLLLELHFMRDDIINSVNT